MKLTVEQEQFKQEMKTLLHSEKFTKMCHESKKYGGDYDARVIYKALGKIGALSPNLPVEFGGRNLGFVSSGVLAEELTNASIPESLFVLSNFIVSNLIYLYGEKQQKERYLREFSSGSKYSIVLFSEPKYGSDLASIETQAVKKGDKFIISGRKVYSMKTHLADYGLLAARTGNFDSKYRGITLFLLPLSSKGVKINVVDAVSDENFFEVFLDQVELSENNIIGQIDEGWTIINNALSLERTGLDYYIRAQKWLKFIMDALSTEKKHTHSQLLSQLALETRMAKEFTFDILDTLDKNLPISETQGAIAKYYSSELANKITIAGIKMLGKSSLEKGPFGIQNQAYDNFNSIAREAPGLLISAGASEIMLETITRNELYQIN
ncbi:putative Dehydrogenase [Carnobacterium maltaromaticum]|uniref:acyl-CoA dehydrogenase family protein n=1 Tax=Carnobacterium maltaromaticum TaxID=2751 RepID=UPI00191BB8D7|nr:acyl-CoA dehydrogenase family protein [Carnobacterium maltaromaticum]CAD5901769.1 putative Dehydrogenase [Carnobacterium maltaromaticum]